MEPNRPVAIWMAVGMTVVSFGGLAITVLLELADGGPTVVYLALLLLVMGAPITFIASNWESLTSSPTANVEGRNSEWSIDEPSFDVDPEIDSDDGGDEPDEGSRTTTGPSEAGTR